jgi:hypothetical protein
MKRVEQLLGALLVLALVSCGDKEELREAVAEKRSAIVGGSEAWLDAAVALTSTQCTFTGVPVLCSGLLISPSVVLTARHCVISSPVPSCPNGVDITKWDTFRVAVGCHDIANGCPSGNWKALASMPTAAEGNYDLAILHLAEAVSVKPTRLATPARLAEITAGDLVEEYGWGKTAETGSASEVLNAVSMPIVAIPSVGVRGMPDSPYLFLVATGQNPYVGTEHGDSGGPTLVFRDGEGFSLGVMSGGVSGSAFNADTLVPFLLEWILSNTSDLPAQSWLPSAQVVATAAILL